MIILLWFVCGSLSIYVKRMADVRIGRPPFLDSFLVHTLISLLAGPAALIGTLAIYGTRYKP